jgi:hypothetical protein
MLVAAALIPDTALLVPGAAGDVTDREDDPARLLRRAAEAAVGEALEGAEHVVVVAPGRSDRVLAPPVRASLEAAGVPDELVWWPAPGPVHARLAGAPASVALFFVSRFVVAHHRANRDARVVEVAAAPGGTRGRPASAPEESFGEAIGSTSGRRLPRAQALRRLGAGLVETGPTTLVVVGSPSGRHGPDAPLADDERAPAYDDALLADLADAGPAARSRLAALDPEVAGALAVTGWGPWQVLLGAAGEARVAARLVASDVVAGASHAVLTWRVGP